MAGSIIGLMILALAGQAMRLPDTSGWKAMPDDGKGYTIAIDPASVKADEARRHFRASIRKLGSPDIVLFNAVADCGAVEVQVQDGYLFRNGNEVGVGPMTLPGLASKQTKDQEGVPEMVAYVCHG